MRRWYFWAILAVLAVAAAGGAATYNLPGLTPVYRSVGILQIRPALEPLLYQTEFNSPSCPAQVVWQTGRASHSASVHT